MSKTFMVSDTHWYHTNVIKYCNRPFADIDEMTEGLVQRWNAVVSPEDTVYHLGDVAMGGKRRAEELSKVLFSLNGKIRMLKGNHDGYVLNTPCRERFEWIRDYYELRYQDKLITLQHFPLFTWNMAGKIDASGKPLAFMLHGHCHGSIDQVNAGTTRMDVGVDSNDYTPVDLDKIVEIMNQRSYAPVDHHGNQTNYY